MPARILATFFLAFFLAVPALAGDRPLDTAEQVVQAVEEVYGETEAIKADFVQVTRAADLPEQRQKGKVVLKRPRKMRWDFTSPEDKVFVTDGKTMWVWSAADNQVIVYEDFAAGSDVANLLTDLDQLDELFEIRLLDEGGPRSVTLELIPKKEEGNLKRLRITFGRKKLLVERVVMEDRFGTETDLSFSQVRLNPKVSDDTFTFQIPEGATVIRPDGT